MRNLIKATVVATVVAIMAQTVTTTPAVDMANVADTAEYINVGAFGTLMYIEEFETAPTNNTASDKQEVIGTAYDVEAATELLNKPLIPCEFCSAVFHDWGDRYDHDIMCHGYCEEHSEYEDCYNEDGSLKDCYHLATPEAIDHYRR